MLFLGEQLKALDHQLANLQEHLTATQVKARTGGATRYDGLSTEVRISTLQSQRIEAENQYQRQAVGLKQLAGLDISKDFALEGGFSPSEGGPESQAAMLAAALEQRPEILQAAEAQRAAQAGVQLATLGAAPTISAHGEIGYKTGVLPNIGSLSFNWLAGVQVNASFLPRFPGSKTARGGRQEASSGRGEYRRREAKRDHAGAAGPGRSSFRTRAGRTPMGYSRSDPDARCGQAAIRSSDAHRT